MIKVQPQSEGLVTFIISDALSISFLILQGAQLQRRAFFVLPFLDLHQPWSESWGRIT